MLKFLIVVGGLYCLRHSNPGFCEGFFTMIELKKKFADLVEDFHFFSWIMYYLFVVLLSDHSDFCNYRLWHLLRFY